MGLAIAGLWNSQASKNIARNLEKLHVNGETCGACAVIWIAAVWNQAHDRPYDYRTRLKSVRPGWRRVQGSTPEHMTSLSALLEQETDGDLRFSTDSVHRYGVLHHELKKHGTPIIVGMRGTLDPRRHRHYVALYKSAKKERRGFDKIKFYWQDNGRYGSQDRRNPGLYETDWRRVGLSFFHTGAHQVEIVDDGKGPTPVETRRAWQ